MTERVVDVGGDYQVVVGPGALDRLAPLVAGRRVMVVHQPGRGEKSFNLASQVFQEDKTYIETIYKKILNKLIKDNLIINDDSKYSLDYEGMMLMVNGGILEKEINLKRKELIQNLIWKVTLVAFVINLLFQMLNLYIRYY